MRNAYLSLVWFTFLICMSACEKDSEAPLNNPPVANAGQDFAISLGQEAGLNGNGSSDQDGDNLTYAWVLKSKPNGSQSSLTNVNAVTANITPDVAGEYVAELSVNDGKGGTAKDDVKITVNSTQVPEGRCRLEIIEIRDSKSILYNSFVHNEYGYLTASFVDGVEYPTLYEYNSDRTLYRINYQNDEGIDYSLYTYVDGLVSEVRSFDDNGDESIKIYTYDDQKRLNETKSEGGFRTVYTYDDRGNVIKEEFYGEDNGNTISTTYTYENFDDKINIFHAVGGLPHSETPFISNNNYGKTTVTEHREGSVSITNYTYEYNSRGYPTKVTATNEDGSVEIRTMTYRGCE